MSDEVLNFQEYWKGYGYENDNSEMSARRAFTFAQLQTHRQYLPLQREVEKLRKQVAAQQSMHPTPPTSRTDIALGMAEAILAKRRARKSAGG